MSSSLSLLRMPLEVHAAQLVEIWSQTTDKDAVDILRRVLNLADAAPNHSLDDDDPRLNDPLDDGLDDDGSLMSNDEPMDDDSTADGSLDDGSDASSEMVSRTQGVAAGAGMGGLSVLSGGSTSGRWHAVEKPRMLRMTGVPSGSLKSDL